MSDLHENLEVDGFQLLEDTEQGWIDVAEELKEFRDHGTHKTELDTALEDYLETAEVLVGRWCAVGSDTHETIRETIAVLRLARKSGTENVVEFSNDIETHHAYGAAWDRRFTKLMQKRTDRFLNGSEKQVRIHLNDYHRASVQLDINRILDEKQTYSVEELEQKNPNPRIAKLRKIAASTMLFAVISTAGAMAMPPTRPSVSQSMLRFFSGGHS